MPFDPVSYAMGAKSGSGGGGLPTPTAADLGAGLTVQATPVPGAVVVPEQTTNYVEDIDGYLLTNVNAELFVAGAKVFATIDNESVIATVEENEDFIYAEWLTENAEYTIHYDKYYEVFSAYTTLYPLPETITVSCNLAVNSYSWAVDPYGGSDVVIKIDRSIAESNLSDGELHLIRGDFAECVNRMQSELPLRILVFTNSRGENDFVYTKNYPVFSDGYANYGDCVRISVLYPAGNSGVFKTIYLTESGLSLVAPG